MLLLLGTTHFYVVFCDAASEVARQDNIDGGGELRKFQIVTRRGRKRPGKFSGRLYRSE